MYEKVDAENDIQNQNKEREIFSSLAKERENNERKSEEVYERTSSIQCMSIDCVGEQKAFNKSEEKYMEDEGDVMALASTETRHLIGRRTCPRHLALSSKQIEPRVKNATTLYPKIKGNNVKEGPRNGTVPLSKIIRRRSVLSKGIHVSFDCGMYATVMLIGKTFILIHYVWNVYFHWL